MLSFRFHLSLKEISLDAPHLIFQISWPGTRRRQAAPSPAGGVSRSVNFQKNPVSAQTCFHGSPKLVLFRLLKVFLAISGTFQKKRAFLNIPFQKNFQYGLLRSSED